VAWPFGIVWSDSESCRLPVCPSRIWMITQTSRTTVFNCDGVLSGRTPIRLPVQQIARQRARRTCSDEFRGYGKCIRSDNSWKGRRCSCLRRGSKMSNLTGLMEVTNAAILKLHHVPIRLQSCMIDSGGNVDNGFRASYSRSIPTRHMGGQ